MSIADNLKNIQSTIIDGVTLVAVSKTKPNEYIQDAYDAGQRIFGENRPQELRDKYDALPKDIEWHFIGHPQSKQVKYFAPFVSLIHGVDSLKLLQVINKEALRNNRIINCLLEFHIAEESSKFGLNLSESKDILNDPEFKLLSNISICGVMGMATYTDDSNQIRREFNSLKLIFDNLKSEFFTNVSDFKEISMGMSSDYQIAIEEGSTMVRIGSSIFGSRL
ncbi:MAG: YggS family pyridoxal phosphate-dependent enzyme [Salinivirgaceae bacterium]|nr:YggS family pyridoxal phosphate-dependent enzyme [Salinivirgaceae bacterium]